MPMKSRGYSAHHPREGLVLGSACRGHADVADPAGILVVLENAELRGGIAHVVDLVQIDHGKAHALERPLDLLTHAVGLDRVASAPRHVDLRGPEDLVAEPVFFGPLTRVRLGAASSVARRAVEDAARPLGSLRERVQHGPVVGELFGARVDRDPTAAQPDHGDLLPGGRDRAGPHGSRLKQIQDPRVDSERRAGPRAESQPIASRDHPLPRDSVV